MEHISDLFGRARSVGNTGKVLNERAELVQFFSEMIERPPKRVGIMLAHYKDISDLYALKSAFNDRLRRDGIETARKWFWWVTKTTTV